MDQTLTARPRTAWQLIKLYWQSDQRLVAYLLIAGLIILSLCLIGLDVIITTWNNYFYNALQDYNKHDAIDLLFIFMFLAGVYIVIAVYRFYVQQYLELRWRRWLTDLFIVRWLDKLNYYFLETFNGHTDNPDQRIQEDIGSLINTTLVLALGALSSIVTIFAFITVLWNLSTDLTISLGKLGTLHFPKYLVWIGIIYALVGTIIAVKIGRPLIGLIFEQQRREANFRFGLIDLRLHSEHVALYRGEQSQQTILQKMFSLVLENWYVIILRQKLLMWFTAGYNQVAVALPFIVVVPTYFSKTIKLGGLMQTLSAFQNIQGALSFIINSYGTIASWQAVTRRLLTFLQHMDEIEKEAMQQNKLVFLQIPANKIVTQNLTINTPQGKTLLRNINQELIHGSHYLIKGSSGLGKSTFLRALAQIWPYGAGEISVPANKKMLFLPQTSYMPIGKLRDALLFPDKVFDISDDILIDLLKKCDLSHLASRLQEIAGWSGQLSQGELQRIAFIRVLIHQPDWVFLDESTSALGVKHEKQMYDLIKNELPACSIVSVSHRPGVEVWHDEEIDLEKYRVQQED